MAALDNAIFSNLPPGSSATEEEWGGLRRISKNGMTNVQTRVKGSVGKTQGHWRLKWVENKSEREFSHLSASRICFSEVIFKDSLGEGRGIFLYAFGSDGSVLRTVFSRPSRICLVPTCSKPKGKQPSPLKAVRPGLRESVWNVFVLRRWQNYIIIHSS